MQVYPERNIGKRSDPAEERESRVASNPRRRGKGKERGKVGE